MLKGGRKRTLIAGTFVVLLGSTAIAGLVARSPWGEKLLAERAPLWQASVPQWASLPQWRDAFVHFVSPSAAPPSDAEPSNVSAVSEPEELSPGPDGLSASMSSTDNRQAFPDADRLIGADLKATREALKAMEEGDFARGDERMKSIQNPTARILLQWAGLHAQPERAGFARIHAFLKQNPSWDGANWLRRRAEDILLRTATPPEGALEYFTAFPPITGDGELVYAQLCQADPARQAEAEALARKLWRENDLVNWGDNRFWSQFSAYLTPADTKYRVDRLLSREAISAASRIAAHGHEDLQAYARIRISLLQGAAWSSIASQVPASFKQDPGLILSRAQNLRRAGKLDDAVKVMLETPKVDPSAIAAPDDWWNERRALARALMDRHQPELAYRIYAAHDARAPEHKIDAEFQAGWVALRFLREPAKAQKHFALAAQIAQTPQSIARANYWRGRAAEEQKDVATRDYYSLAAHYSETYYGQLAQAKMGGEAVPLREPAITAAAENARVEAVRVVEMFYALDDKDQARALAIEVAQNNHDPAQLLALARAINPDRDPRGALLAGKAAMQRGVAMDHLAFPLSGVPNFKSLGKAAAPAVVLSIARQESAFNDRARSSAGAKGLMQMISSTARGTAQHAGVSFDEQRLIADPTFNVQLGAYHLAELLQQYNGSHILAFAAYNAGGGNVRNWIETYGDPRNPDVDPIDWVERIPFNETRNYVQRVVENTGVYRARLGDGSESLAKRDLRQSTVSLPASPSSSALVPQKPMPIP